MKSLKQLQSDLIGRTVGLDGDNKQAFHKIEDVGREIIEFEGEKDNNYRIELDGKVNYFIHSSSMQEFLDGEDTDAYLKFDEKGGTIMLVSEEEKSKVRKDELGLKHVMGNIVVSNDTVVKKYTNFIEDDIVSVRILPNNEKEYATFYTGKLFKVVSFWKDNEVGVIQVDKDGNEIGKNSIAFPNEDLILIKRNNIEYQTQEESLKEISKIDNESLNNLSKYIGQTLILDDEIFGEIELIESHWAKNSLKKDDFDKFVIIDIKNNKTPLIGAIGSYNDLINGNKTKLINDKPIEIKDLKNKHSNNENYKEKLSNLFSQEIEIVDISRGPIPSWNIIGNFYLSDLNKNGTIFEITRRREKSNNEFKFDSLIKTSSLDDAINEANKIKETLSNAVIIDNDYTKYNNKIQVVSLENGFLSKLFARIEFKNDKGYIIHIQTRNKDELYNEITDKLPEVLHKIFEGIEKNKDLGEINLEIFEIVSKLRNFTWELKKKLIY